MSCFINLLTMCSSDLDFNLVDWMCVDFPSGCSFCFICLFSASLYKDTSILSVLFISFDIALIVWACIFSKSFGSSNLLFLLSLNSLSNAGSLFPFFSIFKSPCVALNSDSFLFLSSFVNCSTLVLFFLEKHFDL